MEPNPAAEDLPALYRSVLDRVGQLEAGGQRELARLVRAEATRIYSKAWNVRAKHDLEALLRRHAGAIAPRQTPARAFRRRIFGTA
jgi:hypothetical protein